jgi:tetratricopeptide (TPR) repeat protein
MNRLCCVVAVGMLLLAESFSFAADGILAELLFAKKEAVVKIDDKTSAAALEILTPCFARAVKSGKLEVHTTKGWGWVEREHMMTLKEAEKYANAKDAYGLFIRSEVHSVKGLPKKAMEDLDEAIKLDPKFAPALANRGWLHIDAGDLDNGLADFLAATKADPTYVQAANNLAWFRATCPNAKYRNGKQALAEAKRACEATGYKHEEFLHTLAAACAETGDFKSAVKWLSKAIEIAPGDEEFAEHLKLLKANKPLRDDAK